MGSPPSSIFIVSSWIGFIISSLQTHFESNGIELEPFPLFISTIPYCFYPIVATVMPWLNVLLARDFGPMLKVEREARRCGVSNKGDQLEEENKAKVPDKDTPQLARNALLPILVIMVTVIVSMIAYGVLEINGVRSGLEQDILIEKRRGNLKRVSELEETLDGLVIDSTSIFTYTDVYSSLLYGMVAGTLTCFVLMAMIKIPYKDSVDSMMAGWADMSGALLNLWCAWSLGTRFSPLVLALAIFLVASLIGISVGSAFGTLSILLGFSISLAHQAHPGNLLLLKVAVGCTLSGAVFGNHSSPLADTSIVAAAAAKCSLINHVKTQLPYAFLSLAACFVAVFLAMLNVSPFVCLVVAIALCALGLRLLGSPVDVYSPLKKKRELLDSL
ncbi:hypothetical protein GEMRC1_012928 [Eukaryota sp. GEM-RC1]